MKTVITKQDLINEAVAYKYRSPEQQEFYQARMIKKEVNEEIDKFLMNQLIEIAFGEAELTLQSVRYCDTQYTRVIVECLTERGFIEDQDFYVVTRNDGLFDVQLNCDLSAVKKD